MHAIACCRHLKLWIDSESTGQDQPDLREIAKICGAPPAVSDTTTRPHADEQITNPMAVL
ncbi:hypothetical protein BX600DRAFT_467511 [Xylariales sp. PMI_506]|nr:hypothetical protein BX600DRAFT_467511 [Xylariales sp. PMI_506]